MSAPIKEVLRANCPKCGPNIRCAVRAKHSTSWSHDRSGLSGGTDFLIFECGGCETVFFRRDEHFSEDYTYEYDAEVGHDVPVLDIKSTYWPAQTKRARPVWVDEIHAQDETLWSLLGEVYLALDNEISVLAAIGVRTCFDRATEVLKIDPSSSFMEKLNSLETMGKIGSSEKLTLTTLIDAGSAAAHRGWAPIPKDLGTMVDVLEAFVHRNFVLGEGVQRLAATVPAKVRSSKKSA